MGRFNAQSYEWKAGKRKKKTPKSTLKIDGKTYNYDSHHIGLHEANKKVKKLRKQGKCARVVVRSDYYGVYKRNRIKRKG